MSDSQHFSPMQQLKRSLYAMRNGIVADSLRRSGCPYRLIFGVSLPQMVDIARQFVPDADMAETLWRDESLRESNLIAAMLFPADALSIDRARSLVANNVRWSEDADILCFKLLKFTDFAPQLAAELVAADAPLQRYTGLRLYMNIVSRCPADAAAAAAAELARPYPISALANMLADEADFLLNPDSLNDSIDDTQNIIDSEQTL